MLKAYHTKGIIECGCDEAGRGCLAGPVYAAAVILPPDFSNPLLNDSKQLTEKQRNELRKIIEKESVSWAVASVSHTKIDEINILNASYQAMHFAVDQLNTQPQALLIDGNRFKPYPNLTHHCIIKGDSIFLSIAAASILAKTHRDEHMEQLHKQYPYYGWDRNKGYPTKQHRDAILEHGSSPFHRKSFRLLPEQLELKF